MPEIAPHSLRKWANLMPNFKVDAELVLIPLSVTDHVGHPILDLGAQDFIVAEDGAAQEIRAVSCWDTPASIGVVFDSSGSMKSSVRRAQAAVRALFRDADQKDEAFLIQFADSPRLEVNFTMDVDEIPGKLLGAAPHGATALFDAVYAGLDRMRQAVNAHKALVVVTDGGDNHSRRSFTELLAAARERDVQIFVVAIRRDLRDQDEQRGRAQLDQIANDTGGP
jgi:Ca-activated chloride channel family protein